MAVLRAQLACEYLVQRMGKRGGEYYQHAQLQAFAARSHHDQCAGKTNHDANPAAHANPFTEQRDRKNSDDNRRHEHDGRGGGQRQYANADKEQYRRREHEKRAQTLVGPQPASDLRGQLTPHQQGDEYHMEEEARPDNLNHRVALHQVLGGGIQRHEPEHGNQHPSDADQGSVGGRGRRG